MLIENTRNLPALIILPIPRSTGEIEIFLEYEGIPSQCSCCLKLGHAEDKCPITKNPKFNSRLKPSNKPKRNNLPQTDRQTADAAFPQPSQNLTRTTTEHPIPQRNREEPVNSKTQPNLQKPPEHSINSNPERTLVPNPQATTPAQTDALSSPLNTNDPEQEILYYMENTLIDN